MNKVRHVCMNRRCGAVLEYKGVIDGIRCPNCKGRLQPEHDNDRLYTHHYDCLNCGHSTAIEATAEEHSDVRVCPECMTGAFVDRWKVSKYASGSDGSSLLKIELPDINSVPKVFYKGEEINLKQDVYFHWETDTEVPGGLTYSFQHYDGEAISRIERKAKKHACD
ncbi:hypothetical protein LS684_21025 (plasmid) [Cytobacillus spongiae]|uniref:hypothetical protein n=1 Tax=Cytobacillus spongiae TaxID=2901381 RepID=UPI001F312B3D|nr:hypothetical protein [Cytobacillus spongiae]UII58109.1 hypothetical protein LS684_21025 [Cytobacillus spongiae]